MRRAIYLRWGADLRRRHTLMRQEIRAQSRARKHNELAQSKDDKQLLIDVSVIMQSDARTGIQRVVRSILLQLFRRPPQGYVIRPVYCTAQTEFCYASNQFIQPFVAENIECMARKQPIEHTQVRVSTGDVFFALDLSPRLLARHENTLISWKMRGVRILAMLYDLLPHTHPSWFSDSSVRNFGRWLKTITLCADTVLCISQNVRTQMREWLQEQGFTERAHQLVVLPLGSDMGESLPSTGVQEQTQQQINRIQTQPYLLMVGTVEPRKGYDAALDAMETLWAQGNEMQLVIVGKAGWKTQALQARMEQHTRTGKQLHWLKQVSDETLVQLYQCATALLMASYAEGYGLPLVEAMGHGAWVIARDIPVFREVVGTYPAKHFFEADDVLAEQLRLILPELSTGHTSSMQHAAPVSIDWEQAHSILSELIVVPHNPSVQLTSITRG